MVKTTPQKRPLMKKEIKKKTLRELMDENELNNEALGELLKPKKTKTTISKWNSKSRGVSLPYAKQLAEIFGVDINELDII